MKRPKSLSVVWTPSAIQDLDRIADSISVDSPQGALDACDRLERRAASLNSLSERGRVVPELSAHGVMTYRELIVAPWRLIYRVEDKRFVVLGFFDGRRNLEDLLLERLLAEPEDD